MQVSPSVVPSAAPVALLLVDDRAENLLALEAILAPLGHELVLAKSGEEALARITVRDFALVLLDVRMPGLDGFATAREIHSRARAAHTPIIFLTANDSREDIAEAYANGGVDFLAKPLNPRVLMAKVSIFVELFQQRAEIARHEVQRLLLRQREDALRELTGLLALDAEVARALGTHGTLDSAVGAVADALVRHLGCAFAGIWIANEDGAVLELQARAGSYESLDEAHATVVVGTGEIGKIASTRSPHLTNDVLLEPGFSDRDWAAREKMVAFAGYPLVLGDELLGVMAAYARQPFSDSALLAMRSIAGGVAQGIERLRSEALLRVAHREAKASRDHLHSLFMQAPTPICILRGPEHHFELTNPMYRELVGQRDLIGLPVREALPELAGQGFFELLDRVYTTGERFVGREVPIKHARASTGELVESIVNVVYEPYRDESGVVVGILTIAPDVTDAVRARQALEQLLTERERLLNVAEESREKADIANRAKDEFLATASHELRTPLNAILGWARMLRSGQLDPSGYMRGLETIERNAKSQVQLIEDILDGSRMITGKLHLETRPLDMTALVRAALDAVRPAVDAKSIALSVIVDPAAAHVLGDPERLQQVVWNLANNAVKFTPKGGAIEVRLERSGTHIELSVSDTGQGISADFLPHVFERFRQADGSTTRRHGGLGLGLALVRHIVEAHGGVVRAESAGEGKGARFSVHLPVRAVGTARSGEPERRRPSDDEIAVALTAHLTGVNVLVVDDEHDARDLVATILRANGAEVTTAASAVLALESLSKSSPMVLISDVGMPEKDGYELIRTVREHAERSGGRRVPAIALTAYSREDDRRRALEAGFDTHVVKPVDPAELVRIVALAAQSSNQPRSPDQPEVSPDRGDSFAKFEKLVTARGIQDALRFLNSRTPHRFTGIYRFEPPILRSVALVDSDAPEVAIGADMPMDETYCSIVGQSQLGFTTEDARSDDRLRLHAGRDRVRSYCGVLLRDESGQPFGTLCHFDVVPCDVPVKEVPFMEAAARLLMKAVQRLSDD